ncbi:GH92 family glycosyl hydrolase [Streptomyces turgidiscabies]|uniref:Putative alpha-1,2-mannosidase n=1 Tax=Streptomyces turgidiscabies (strain Car8) TaxID=698760 RepID=L7FI25_STRT8|nr:MULTISPECIES: GH92 family glycosyl hydrolase [Streptomyces]ELP70706.1 putative alpha-1,2-mannosidase [Streptomyces turgidiscabies Car8]MDX3495183.1 GH92 family glycosyl hydrolase [Streptomyces turgidiscabies]GAQ71056.1 glycosyl hydrolase family 92 [Streptomyces turgidiscabies]
MRVRPTSLLLATALMLGTPAPTLAATPTSQTYPLPLVQDPTPYVDPLIGTRNGGDVFPGAVVPFGMLSWSPENTRGDAGRTAAPGGYHYDATRIRGFSLTHMSGTGCAGGSGDIPFFPYAGEVTSSPASDTQDTVYAADFSHADETAEPGHYRVRMASGVTADLTATTRAGSARFTYPPGRPASMLIRTANSEVGSTDSTVTIDTAARTVSGSVTSGNFCGHLDPEGRRPYYTLHFTARFDHAFKATGTWQDGRLSPGATSASGGTGGFTANSGRPVAGRGAGGYVEFEPGAGPVGVKVGISYVSRAGAEANLAAENPSARSFTSVQQAARRAWRDRLAAIKVGGGTEAERTTFYTALYHSLLHPNVISDADRRYRGGDDRVHLVRVNHDHQYGTFSGWDVYRSQVQLLTLLDPDTGSDIAQSLYELARQNGGLWDRWLHGASGTHVMNGDPSPAALAGIRAFGGRRFDLRGALDSLVRAATTPTRQDLSPAGRPVLSVGQRPSLDAYLAHHYMPSVSNAWGGAAETLEMSGADFALAELARAAGRTRTANDFMKRAQWWQNNFDISAHSSGGYITDRKADGSRATGFTPATGKGFVEGTAAQYTWMVPHNPAGLFAAMGGTTTAVDRLDAFFHHADGSWALTGSGGEKSELDNEPSVNVPYLYAYAGAPRRTQETVRAAMTRLWSTRPGGIPGNDDLGAMSSWYVFAALGMYPQVPSRAELVLASPLFPRIEINRPYGNDISIHAQGASADTPYVQSLAVNGLTSDRPWLPASFVRHGGTLDYTLAATPHPTWGTAPSDAPPSFRSGEQPFQFGVGPTTATLAPGGSARVDIRALSLTGTANRGPEVRFEVETPTGVTATPVSGRVVDGVQRITFSAPPTAGQGFHEARIRVTATDTAYEQPVALTVAAPGSLLAAYDNTGTSDDTGDHTEADYDGAGWSYSRQALEAEGLTPGTRGTLPTGMTFTWPSSPPGRPDNASAASQIIQLAAPVSRLSFVGSAAFGSRRTRATVTYTDGTTDTVDLALTDWTLGGGTGTVQYGNEVVARTAYRNVPGAGRDPVPTYVFATRPFQAPGGRSIASVRLPANANVHVFTLAVG